MFSDLECLSIIIACLSHDLDHRGTNNQFQIRTMSPLVNLYSTSVLEHHHFDQCIMLLSTKVSRTTTTPQHICHQCHAYVTQAVRPFTVTVFAEISTTSQVTSQVVFPPDAVSSTLCFGAYSTLRATDLSWSIQRQICILAFLRFPTSCCLCCSVCS